MYNIMPFANSGIFTFFLSNFGCFFIYFSFLIALARTANTMLSKSGILFTIKYDVSCDFVIYGLYYVEICFFKIFIVIQLQLYAFSPHPSTPPQLNPSPSPTSTLTLGFVHVSSIVVPVIPSSHCPHPTPPWLLLDCS